MSETNWLGLRHLALRVADPQVSKNFYRRVFGMKVEWEPDSDNVYMTSGQDNLALHRGTRPFDPEGALDHFGFVVRTKEAVDTWHEHIKSLQIPIRQDIKTHRDGARSFYFADPDGHVIQILYHPPLAGLPGSQVDPRESHSQRG